MVHRLIVYVVALTAATTATPAPQPGSSAIVNTTSEGPANVRPAVLATAKLDVLGGSAGSSYHSPAWLPAGQSLGDPLLQSITNGASILGTLDAPRLPHFLGATNASDHDFPWGARRCNDSNVYTDTPITGVTRYYDFSIASATIAPDGVEKPALLVNGQFPGPTIEANWGDWIQVTVHNGLTEGTSLHWHGMLQKDTPWFDGVPGVAQCPIAPGSSFTYRFRADLYGTTWYHSHYSMQVADGLFGPLIIHGPHDNAKYDEDLGPVLVGDWYHTEYHTIVDRLMAPASENLPPPFSNNVLINGKMNYPCANVTTGAKCTPNAGVSKFRFRSGKSYRLRLINVGAEGMQKFSIDNHKLLIIANDMVPIVPYETNMVNLGVGQRADIVVHATGKPTDAVWMRSNLGPSFLIGGCSLPDGISPEGVAAIYYEHANTSAVPTTTSDVTEAELVRCLDDPLEETVPYYPIAPTMQPDIVQQMNLTIGSNGTHDLFFMDNSSFRADYNDPVLLDAKAGQVKFPTHYNVYNFGQSQSNRIVIYNHAFAGSHPMHIHGHNMYVLAVGTGDWDGKVTNPSNPLRRDTAILPVPPNSTIASYLVLQFDADNPGVWPLHCHIAHHVSQGIYVSLLERPQDIQRDMQIPSIMGQTCKDWSAWTNRHVVDELDSGV